MSRILKSLSTNTIGDARRQPRPPPPPPPPPALAKPLTIYSSSVRWNKKTERHWDVIVCQPPTTPVSPSPPPPPPPPQRPPPFTTPAQFDDEEEIASLSWPTPPSITANFFATAATAAADAIISPDMSPPPPPLPMPLPIADLSPPPLPPPPSPPQPPVRPSIQRRRPSLPPPPQHHHHRQQQQRKEVPLSAEALVIRASIGSRATSSPTLNSAFMFPIFPGSPITRTSPAAQPAAFCHAPLTISLLTLDLSHLNKTTTMPPPPPTTTTTTATAAAADDDDDNAVSDTSPCTPVRVKGKEPIVRFLPPPYPHPHDYFATQRAAATSRRKRRDTSEETPVSFKRTARDTNGNETVEASTFILADFTATNISSMAASTDCVEPSLIALDDSSTSSLTGRLSRL